MQRKPKLVQALAQLNAAVMDPEGEVDLEFRRLLGHLASKASGCRYCQAQPNEVTDVQFERLRRHWSDSQIVEMLGVVAIFGFLNRWNDTKATPLEATPAAVASTALGDQGWTAGKHAA